jgi:hypothetical protein
VRALIAYWDTEHTANWANRVVFLRATPHVPGR